MKRSWQKVAWGLVIVSCVVASSYATPSTPQLPARQPWWTNLFSRPTRPFSHYVTRDVLGDLAWLPLKPRYVAAHDDYQEQSPYIPLEARDDYSAGTKRRYDPARCFRSFGLAYLKQLHINDSLEVIPTDFADGSAAYKKSMLALAKKIGPALKNHETAPVYLQWISRSIGYGVFAKKKIPQGFIGEYTGLIVPATKDLSTNRFIFTFPGICRNKATKQTVECFIDAGRSGNYTRFVNHSNHPNVTVQYALIPEDPSDPAPQRGYYHVIYSANRTINADEELTVHYGKAYWESVGHAPQKLTPKKKEKRG